VLPGRLPGVADRYSELPLELTNTEQCYADRARAADRRNPSTFGERAKDRRAKYATKVMTSFRPIDARATGTREIGVRFAQPLSTAIGQRIHPFGIGAHEPVIQERASDIDGQRARKMRVAQAREPELLDAL